MWIMIKVEKKITGEKWLMELRDKCAINIVHVRVGITHPVAEAWWEKASER